MEHATRTLTRTWPAALALAVTLFAAPPAEAAFEVILADGSRVAASTRPVIALGRVNFHEAGGRAVSLPAAGVDLVATRAALRRESGLAAPLLWTAESLAANPARVQVLTSADPPAAGPAGEGATNSARATNADRQELMRRKLDIVERGRRSVRAEDPEAAILEERFLLLQTELLRLQHAPDAIDAGPR